MKHNDSGSFIKCTGVELNRKIAQYKIKHFQKKKSIGFATFLDLINFCKLPVQNVYVPISDCDSVAFSITYEGHG